MRSSIKRLTLMPALAMSLFLWSCDGISEVTQPLSPENASFAKGGNGKSQGKGAEQAGKKGPKVRGKDRNGVEKEYHAAVRKNAPSSKVVSMVVEPNDGPQVLSLGSHTLTVSGESVTKSTRFTMREVVHTLDNQLVLAVDLHASSGRGRNTEDVGAAGFPVPVTLCLSSSDTEEYLAAMETNAELPAYDLVWFKGIGNEVEYVEGDASTAGAVTCGLLDHFSMWGLAWP